MKFLCQFNVNVNPVVVIQHRMYLMNIKFHFTQHSY